jgi:hypothetical protein
MFYSQHISRALLGANVMRTHASFIEYSFHEKSAYAPDEIIESQTEPVCRT